MRQQWTDFISYTSFDYILGYFMKIDVLSAPLLSFIAPIVHDRARIQWESYGAHCCRALYIHCVSDYQLPTFLVPVFLWRVWGETATRSASVPFKTHCLLVPIPSSTVFSLDVEYRIEISSIVSNALWKLINIATSNLLSSIAYSIRIIL